MTFFDSVLLSADLDIETNKSWLYVEQSVLQSEVSIYNELPAYIPGMLQCKMVMEWQHLSLQMLLSDQTGVIDLGGAKVSPDNFKTWDPLIKFRNLQFLICLFISTVTFLTISPFHWLTEILYGHGSPTVIMVSSAFTKYVNINW